VDRALRGEVDVIQRERGAGVQRAFENARVDGDSQPASGPLAKGHVDAVRCAVATGLPAVTIEPAALALGAQFHPLEVHVVELWVDEQWIGDRAVTTALDALSGARFRRQLSAVGGYDLGECGVGLA
jgi:hypothetical protein